MTLNSTMQKKFYAQYPYSLPKGHTFIEVVDEKNIPFMVMPMQEALSKRLPCRHVFVILRHYKDDKLLLLPTTHKINSKEGHEHSTYTIEHVEERDATHTATTCTQTQWGILYTNVLAGESLEGAALRLLYETFQRELAISPAIEHIQRLHPYNSPTESHTQHNTDASFLNNPKHTAFFLFDIGKNVEKFQESIEHLWLDFDEIAGFATHFEDMLSSILLSLIREGQLLSICQKSPRGCC